MHKIRKVQFLMISTWVQKENEITTHLLSDSVFQSFINSIQLRF